MVAEPEHEWDRALLYDLGQDELDGWGRLGVPDECQPPVLQGDGGDAVGVAAARGDARPPRVEVEMP